MPQAVSSNSIPVLSGQPAARMNLEVFSDTLHQLDALTLMLGAALDANGSFNENIVVGITGLFRQQIDDLRPLKEAAREDRTRLSELSMHERALERLRSSDFELSDEEIKLNATLRIEKKSQLILRVPSSLQTVLDGAAKHHNRSVSNLASMIIRQWLFREGWLTVPESTQSEDVA